VAYIRKHKTGWRAEVQRNGVRATHVAKTKREATEWAVKKEAEIGNAKKLGIHTLEEAATKYIETVSINKANPRTDKVALAGALTFFGASTKLSDITSEVIANWRDSKLKETSGSTVNRYASVINHMLKVAAKEWNWIEKNPFEGVKLPLANPARTAVWTWPLIRRVLRSPQDGPITNQVKAAFHISLHTGLRLQEVLTGQFDSRRRVIILPRSKTSKVPVEVPVTRRAVRVLSEHMGKFTVPPHLASLMFTELRDKLLIKGLTFHDARASALTWLSRKMDVMTLARISRHKDLRILMNTYYRESAESISSRLKV
jgi:integrase